MKTIPITLQTGREGGATTECLIVKVECTGAFKGITLGFTSLDEAVVYDDGTGELTYTPDYGFTPSALQFTNTSEIDNGEVLGIIRDSTITYEMVRAGLFNYAEVTAYCVDYMDLGKGHEVVFNGTCGETEYTDTTWKTEFRSITQRTQQVISQTYSKDYCRAQFGDARCGVPLTWVSGTVDSAWFEDLSRGFIDASLASGRDDGYFVPGVVQWVTGRNAGMEMDIAEFSGAAADEPGFVRLLLTMPFPIEAGDTFRIRRDCDKSAIMCRDVYDNEPRYRFEPLINLTGEGLYSYTAPRVKQNYGNIIGAVIGAVIGYLAGNVQMGIQIGSFAGGRHIPDTSIGPRLSEASTQTNAATVPIPFGYGKFSVSGNVIEAGASVEVASKKKKKSKWYDPIGQLTASAVTYKYYRSFKIGVCEGAINGYLQIRRDGKTIYYGGTRAEILFNTLVAEKLVDSTDDVLTLIEGWPGLDALYANPILSLAASLWLEIYNNATDHGGIPAGQNQTVGGLGFLKAAKTAVGFDEVKSSDGFKLFYGTEEQEFYACKDLDTEGLSPAYKGLAYVAFDAYEVTETGGALPTFEFVVERGAAKSYTTPPYPVYWQDGLTSSLSRPRGATFGWTVEDMVAAATPLGGQIRDVKLYYDMEFESLEVVGCTPLGGEVRNVKLYYDMEFESLEVVGCTPLGGGLQTVVLHYNNWPQESLDATLTPLGGALS